MKTKSKAAATAKTVSTTKKSKSKKATTRKAETPPPVVKFRESTLQLMGFCGRGETICHETNKGLAKIGKLLHRRGLIPHCDDWWQRVPVVDVVRFSCDGRDYEIRVYGYLPQESKWRVGFIQGPTELEEWLEKRPSEPHPERTSWGEWTLDEEVLLASMKIAKAEGIDNFEDFINKVMGEAMQRDKKLVEGLAPMHFDERMVRYLREFCEVAGVDADQWAESWIAVHLRDAEVRESKAKPGKMILEGVVYDLLAPGHYPHIRNKKAKLAKMQAILERYHAEEAQQEGGQKA